MKHRGNMRVALVADVEPVALERIQLGPRRVGGDEHMLGTMRAGAGGLHRALVLVDRAGGHHG